jgi:hypothetical protein
VFSGDSTAKEAAEKLISEGVILTEAKDLLFALAEKKADPSDRARPARPQDDTPTSFSAACKAMLLQGTIF